MMASIVGKASGPVDYATFDTHSSPPARAGCRATATCEKQRGLPASCKGSDAGRGLSLADGGIDRPRRGSVVWLAVFIGWFACESVIAQDQACSKCGPGAHWIDTCAAGQDLVDDHVVFAGIDLKPGGDCPATTTADLEPCAAPDDSLVVNRSEPRDDSVRFPGFRPDNGHLDVIDTELISMCLTNPEMTITYRAGAGTGVGPQGANLQATFGAIGEVAGSGAKVGESFFEVFFEIEVIMGMGPPTYLYNHAPLRMGTNITCVPPATVYNAFPSEKCLPLFNDPDPGEGEWIADGTALAQHALYEEELGCCWRCVEGAVECTPGVVASASAFNFVPNGVCGTTACGSCDQPGPPLPPHAQIPTMPEWGLIVMTILVIAVGAIMIHQRRTGIAAI